MTRVYYAHPVTTYDKPIEATDRTSLERLGFEVVCPNTPVHDVGYKCDGMDYFKGLVESCDALAFRAFPGGRIPAGIGKEIRWAREAGLDVIELPGCLIDRVLGVNHTRELLIEMGG